MKPGAIAALEGAAGDDPVEVEIEGWISPFQAEPASRYFALVEESPCCIGCLPREPARRVEVFADEDIEIDGTRVRLRGRLKRLDHDEAGWRFQLRQARRIATGAGDEANFTRRRVLHAGAIAGMTGLAGLAAIGLPGCATPAEVAAARTQGRQPIDGLPTVDVHSHDGGLIGLNRVQGHGPFRPLADPMRDGGMAVVCLAIVSDTPTHHLTPDHRIRPFRDPAPGELQAYGQLSFERLHALAQAQGLAIVATADDLRRARSERPSIVVSAEGGDFLEGRVERVDEAHAQWTLRHLQLTHYRVNELGDIQTEAPVHGGLTPVGAEVIRRCNRLGIVVDVAHGTFELVQQAAAVTTRPLVLSHTSLSPNPAPRSRLISPAHARVIADTGGLIGIWPPKARFADLPALASGMARMVDVVGVDHVALGSDMRGLTGPSVFDTYRDLPLLAKAMLDHGFSADEVRRILGGNYVRVFGATLEGATAPS